MRSLIFRSTLLMLWLVPSAFALAKEPPTTLPLAQNGISLLAQPQDAGWVLHFQIAEVIDGAEIRYRRLGAREWKTVPETGGIAGPLDIGPIGTGEQVIEAVVVDAEGEGTGRFRLSFDPQQERVRQAHYFLDHVLPNRWVGFGDTHEGKIYASFGTVWNYKDALRSIRYSLDSCDLDRTPEASYGPIPSRFTYLCLQVVYSDGETSPPRIFFKERPVAPPRPTAQKSVAPEKPGAEISVPVRLETLRHNAGWSLRFEVEDRASVAEFRYRLETHTAWRSTGDLPWISPRFGRRLANPEFAPDPLEVAFGRQKIEVQLVGTDGAVAGPYALWFDPDADILTAGKADLGDPDRAWGTFEEANARGVPFYLAVFDARDALREIRYSVDDCGVGQRFDLPPWNDITASPPYPDLTILWVPKTTAFVCLQLVFTDGEVSEVRRFENGEEKEDIVANGE